MEKLLTSITSKVIKTLLFLLVTFSFWSCANFKNFHSNKARGEAGIVRVPQYEYSICNKKHIDSCNNSEQKEKGTFLWSYYNANRRGSMMYVHNNKIRVLAENAPDAAIQSIADISAKVKVIESVDVEAAFKTQRTIAQLGKRTAAVNMLRDALYRLNELYYASMDENSELITKAINKCSISDSVFLNSSFGKSFAKNEFIANSGTFEKLFTTVIDNAKEISIKESEAEIQIASYESRTEVERQKSIQIKLNLIQEVLGKTEGKLGNDESKKMIEKILITK